MRSDGSSQSTFRYFVIGSASALLGSEVFYFIVPLLVLSLGYSSVVAGWCSFAFFAPVIGGKLLAGPIVERQNKKVVLVKVEVGRLITVATLGAGLYAIPQLAIPFVLIAAFVMGTLAVFSDTAEPAMLKALLSDRERTGALSTYEVRTRTVQLIGPTVGGIMLSLANFVPLFASQVCSVLAILFYKKVEYKHNSERKTSGFRADISSAALWMIRNRMYTTMVLLTAMNNFIHPILYLTVVYNAHNAGYDPGEIGLILAGLGAGGIAGSLASPMLSRHLKTEQIVLLVNVLRIAVFAGFACWNSPVIMFSLFVLKAVLGGSWNVCYNVYTIGVMPHDYIARLSSLSSLIIKCCTALGSLAAGYSIAILGSQSTLWILVLLTIVMFASSLTIRNAPGDLS